MSGSVRPPIERRTYRSYPYPLGRNVVSHPFESEILRDNPWGDPHVRELACYVPPSGKTEGLPLLVHLAGFTGAGWMEFLPRGPFGDSLIQLFDRMVRSGACPEAVLIAPDGLTSLGGSQYVNSSATGRYADYIAREIVPWAKEKFRTGRTGVLGQSSGGFGALHLGMEYPDLFDAVGSSAGDAAFDYAYLHDLPRGFREFQKAGGPEAWMEKLFTDPSTIRSPTDSTGAALNTLAMASCYSPVEEKPGSFDLPLDLETGALRPGVWKRWLAFDPVVRVAEPAAQAALRKKRLVHITASAQDEFSLDVGARIFVGAAKRAGVPVRYDEFPGGHFDRAPRFTALFTEMTRALSADAT